MNSLALSYRFDSVPAGPRDHIRQSFLPPSLPSHLEAKTVPHDRDNNARNIRGSSARPLAYTITQKEYRERSARAFRDFAGDSPGAAKKVAAALECSEKTAQNYLDARNAPGPIHDSRALYAVPHYAAMKRELAAMEMDHDPRLQAKFNELIKYIFDYGDIRQNGGKP